MRRIAFSTLCLILVLLIASQFALPRLVASRVERRLTAQGGSAHVELAAVPAVRLLTGGGDSIKVRASGLALGLDQSTSPQSDFNQLDKFDSVDVQVDDSSAGPLQVSTMRLERANGSDPYRVTLKASVTAGQLSAFAGGVLGGGLGSMLGGLAAGALPFSSQPIPIDVASDVRSVSGRPTVENISGSIAGLPAGPVVVAIADALAGRF